MDAEGEDASPAMVECWYWRYRDPGTGQVCVSEKTLTAEEASSLPEAAAEHYAALARRTQLLMCFVRVRRRSPDMAGRRRSS